MNAKHVRGLFITGTDTGVGKTYVAALIARELTEKGRRVGVYKPAASGCRVEGKSRVSGDAIALWAAAGKPGSLQAVCPQRFAAPLAPHLAAEAEGKQINPDKLRQGLKYWRERSEIVIVEGAGGLLSPIGYDDYICHLVAEFGFPLVIVAANRLGTINQTLQTAVVAAVLGDRVRTAGVVLNDCQSAKQAGDPSMSTNAQELRGRCELPLLARVAHGGKRFTPHVDWWSLAAS